MSELRSSDCVKTVRGMDTDEEDQLLFGMNDENEEGEFTKDSKKIVKKNEVFLGSLLTQTNEQHSELIETSANEHIIQLDKEPCIQEEVKPEVKPKPSRFSRCIDIEEVEKAIVERVPKNTVKSTNWRNKVLEAWCVERQLLVVLR